MKIITATINSIIIAAVLVFVVALRVKPTAYWLTANRHRHHHHGLIVILVFICSYMYHYNRYYHY